jgi:hypothetical protein
MARRKKQSREEYRIVRKRVASLKPSPENLRLYRSPDEDRDLAALAASIQQHGLQEPLVITLDNYIISGHRRHAALLQIGQAWCPCRIVPIRRDETTTDDYIALLREHNRQRNKTVAEQVCEEMVDIDPEQAHARLRYLRDKSVNAVEHNGVATLSIEGKQRRYAISEDKAEHVKYVLQIVEARREFWPLSVRGVHYPLLNHSFVRGYYWPRRNEPDFRTRRTLRYQNDDGSYDATSDLITRLRLNGKIPWEAFDDFTRPKKEFPAFRDVRHFVRQQIERLFAGYWRLLLQSQPCHVEVVCEKNTVYHMGCRVTKKYQIPTSSGRGFNSIDPWHDLYESFRNSQKERLIVIVLSDYDPEGELIPIVGARTLRDDFGMDPDKFDIVKAGVTEHQIHKYHLPPQNFAKESSPNYDWFVKRNNGNDAVYELEALEPQNMMDDLESVIQAVIDIDLFNREATIEQEEAVYLDAARKAAMEALKGLGE